jgi:type III pantothenate kinase
MIFGVDIGNTNITCGIISSARVQHHWRLSTPVQRTPDEISLLLSQLFRQAGVQLACIQKIVISSVVPPVLQVFRQSLIELFSLDPFIVQPGIKLNLKVNYVKPQDVGADRIVNAVAATHKFGCPVVILDFGTATTFCVVNAKNEYMGGAIFPGIITMSDALYKAAAMLPRVAFKQPPSVIGKSTSESIQSGLFFGSLDMIEGMLRRIHKTADQKIPVVATGGLAEHFHAASGMITHLEPDLTLRGLEIIYELNHGNFTGLSRWEIA